MTYHMELHRPKEEKTPFVCQLTFTAAGGMHGDIVQVRVNSPNCSCISSSVKIMNFVLTICCCFHFSFR